MTLARKPFAKFAVELAAGLATGRGDEPLAESATFKIVEMALGDWRLRLVFNHAVEVIGDESWPTREAAVEEIINRLERCPGWDEIRTEPIQ